VQVRGACAGLPHALSARPMLVSGSSTVALLLSHSMSIPDLALALCPRALIARYRVLHLLHLALGRERVAQVVGEGLEDIARLHPQRQPHSSQRHPQISQRLPVTSQRTGRRAQKDSLLSYIH